MATAWLGAALLASVAAGCGGSGPAVGKASGSAEVVAADGATATSTSTDAGGAGPAAGGAGSATGSGGGSGSGAGPGLAVTVSQPGPIDLSGRPVRVTGANTAPGEIDRYTFTGTARERISVEIVTLSDGCSGNALWNLDLDVLGPDGQPVRGGKGYAGIVGCSGYGPWTLPADGTYTLTFTSEGTATGSYTAIVGRLADTAATIDLQDRAVVAGAIDVALDSRRYSFQATAGQRISAEVTSLNDSCETSDMWGLVIDIVDANNQPVRGGKGYAGITGCSGYGPWTLPAAGTYTVTFTGDGAGKGTYKATLARLARTATPVDLSRPVTVQGSIDVALDSRSYTFSGTKGQKVSVQVTALNGGCDLASAWDLDVDLVGSDGEKVGSTGYAGITGCTTFDPWILPANGDYAITFRGEQRGKGAWAAVLSRTG